MPKISIIVPIYDVEQYIERCLESILRQTYQDYEIICINDCSPDQSQTILNAYQEKYPDKITVMVNERNLGLGRTRERGIGAAKGDFLCFIDSDDYIKKDFLEKYYHAWQSHPCDVIVGGYIRDIDGNKQVHYRSNSDWSVTTYASVCTKMFRKNFVTDHHLEFTDISCGEDIFFSMSAYACGLRYYVLEDYAGYFYYFNRKSITGAMNYKKAHEKIMSDLFSELMKKYDITNLDENRRRVIEYTYISNMINALITFNHGCKPKLMKQKYDFFLNDLKAKFPDYSHNPYLSLGKSEGQTGKIRLGVGVTMLLHRLHMDRMLYYLISLI